MCMIVCDYVSVCDCVSVCVCVSVCKCVCVLGALQTDVILLIAVQHNKA